MDDSLTKFEMRASTVLYRYLRSVDRPGIWLLPANVCPIVPAIFLKAGLAVEFLDISPETLCLDLSKTMKRVAAQPEKFAGLLFVHTYGSFGNFDDDFTRLKLLAGGIQIIDDRCLCAPSFHRLGNISDLELYSAGYSKFVDMGWGGWGYLSSASAYRVEPLEFDESAHGQLVTTFRISLRERTPFVLPEDGWLDVRKPDISLDQFQTEIETRLPEVTRHREKLNAIYFGKLGFSSLPIHFQNWRFTFQCDCQQELLQAIFDAGHFASGHYQSLTPMFGSGHTPLAEQFGRQVVNLFNDFRYTAERAQNLADIVSNYLGERKTLSQPAPLSR